MIIKLPTRIKKKSCLICGRESKLISSSIGICVECLRADPDKSLPYIEERHSEVRRRFGLPPRPPKSPDGIRCNLCSAECVMGVGEMSYCGLM